MTGFIKVVLGLIAAQLIIGILFSLMGLGAFAVLGHLFLTMVP